MARVPESSARPGNQLPAWFGKHLLLTKLATGGMGEVFLARMRSAAGFEKLLVLKRLLPHLSEQPRFVEMFLDEARIAARISHSNVCQIYELGEVDGQYYITMEYLEGVPLGSVLERRPRDPRLGDLLFLCGLLTQVSEGLHGAHDLHNDDGTSAGVVHRDVCLSNIHVTWSGIAKLLDFGVAKARGVLSKTRPGAVKGTYAYMSPEQLHGEDVDARSDIFSLGVVAWETIAGRRLFKRKSDFKIFKAITEEPIPPVSRLRPETPPSLSHAIQRALARDPADRFQTAREFGTALTAGIESLGPPMQALRIGELLRDAFAPEIDRHRARIAALYRVDPFQEDEEAVETKEMPVGPGRRREDGEAEHTTHPLVELPLTAPTTTTGQHSEDLQPPDVGSEGEASGPADIDLAPPAHHGRDADESAVEESAVEPSAVEDPSGQFDAKPADTAETPAPGGRRSRSVVAVLIALIAVTLAIIIVLVVRGRSDSEPERQHLAQVGAHTSDRTDPAAEPAPVTRPAETRSRVAPEVEPERGPPRSKHSKPAKKPRAAHRPPRTKPKPSSTEPAKQTRTGKVTLESQPYATVYIDDQKLGYTPIVGHVLSAGHHTVRAVSSANGREQKFSITVDPDKPLRRRLKW